MGRGAPCIGRRMVFQFDLCSFSKIWRRAIDHHWGRGIKEGISFCKRLNFKLICPNMKKEKTCNLESEKTLFPTYTVRYFVTASIFSTALFLAIVHVWGQKLNFPFILFTFQFYHAWSLGGDFPNENLQKTLFHEGRLVQPGSVGAVGAGTWQAVGQTGCTAGSRALSPTQDLVSHIHPFASCTCYEGRQSSLLPLFIDP